MRYDIGGHGTTGATGDTTQEDKDMEEIGMDMNMGMDTDMGFKTGMATGKPRKAYARDSGCGVTRRASPRPCGPRNSGYTARTTQRSCGKTS